MKIRMAILVCSIVIISPALVMGTPTTIAQWTFETSASTNNIIGAGLTPGTTQSGILADIGAGTASASHALSAAWSVPAGNGTSHSWSANYWSKGDYFQFQVSTIGYNDITLSWDQTGSGTGPSDFQLFWGLTDSTGSFTLLGTDYLVPSPTSTWKSYTNDLSSILAINNAGAVYFRLVDESTTGPGTGTDRVDNFTVSGDKIPDSMPGLAGLACGLGLLEIIRRTGNASNPLSRRDA